ncbi:MAG: DNA cytosine methyltransferase, partial [Clostridia bacterium]|nr:DNA cytosine methyltransferase [Clostridia bacterium]
LFLAEVEPFPCAVLGHRLGATRPLRPLDPAEAADEKDRKNRESWLRQIKEAPEGGTLPNLGDFTKIRKEDYNGDIDLLVGGTPCFPAGNMVLTEHGYAPIEEIRAGDMVMTHLGRLRRVLATGRKIAGNVGVCRVIGRPAFRVTANHPFLTGKGWRNHSRKSADYARLQIADAQFRPIGESEGDFGCYLNPLEHPCDVQTPALPEVYSATDAQILELCGWYLGDGYIRNFDEGRKKCLVLCLSQRKLDVFKEHFGESVHYSATADRNGVYKVQIACTALAVFLREWFGHLAGEKRIPAWVYGLNGGMRDAFMTGYRMTDGCMGGNTAGYTSISKGLAYGVADLCSFSSVTFVNVKPTTEICGRKVSQRPWFRIAEYNPSTSRKLHRHGRWLFGRIRKFELQEQPETVFNLEVEDDNSYICNGLCVHNCQSYSIAGLRKGLADPRGNLALEFVRLAYRTGARWTVWENVPGVLSSGAGGDFASLLSLLCGWEVPVPAGGWGRCGIVANAPGCYGLAWRVLDAQYTRVPMFPRAIPQRRRRVFLVGYRGGAFGGPLDWIHPASVLLDGEVREGDTPPRRAPAQGASAASAGG